MKTMPPIFDRASQAIRLLACLLAVGWSIAAVDSAISQSAPASAGFQEHPLQHVDVSTAQQQLEAILDNRSDVDIVADRQRNRLLVRGSQQAQQLVGQLLRRIDVPAQVGIGEPRDNSGISPETSVQGYSLTAETRPVFDRWRQYFANRTDVRIAYDDRSAQVLVVAPEDVQRQVAQSIPAAGRQDTIRILPRGTEAGVPQGGLGALGGTRQNGRLQNLTPEQLHQRLEKAFGRPMAAGWDATRSWYRFQTEPGAGGVAIAVHGETGEVRIEGPPTQAADWRRVVNALDQPPAPGFPVTDLVPTGGRNREQVQRAVQVLLAANQVAGDATAQADVPPPTGIRVAQLPQTETDTETAVPGEEGAFGSLLGPVEIVYVEGLDVILIRGRDEDVARVREIIEQLQAAAGETLPKVVVHHLRQVDSVSIAALLGRVYSEVLGPRTGDILITPLGSPNALLLVGREENIQLAVDLIDQLDQAVAPSSRFHVFPLRHASAADVKPMIDELLSGPPAAEPVPATEANTIPTLRPRGLVVADFRTNSLIVSASPRDLAEIEALIQRVDVGTTQTRDQVKVITLRHTVATDLAEVLQEAIQPPAEAAAAPAAGAAATSASPRSAALELLSIDGAEQKPIQSGILTGVRITAEVRTNSLVVSAPAESLPLVEALIRQLDVPPEVQAEVKVFTLQNGDAVGLVDTLRELFGDETAATEVGGIGAGENALVPLQLSVDPRTNSIIAAGTTADLEVVEAILFRLDGSDSRERITEVIRLKNATAQPVSDTLTAYLDSRRTAVQEAQLNISPFEQIDREVIVVPELVSNSLVVSATPRYIDEIRKIINDLDQRPPMVMIQVLIADVQLGDADEFGVELGLQDSLLFDRSILQQPPDTIQRSTQTTSAGGATISTVTEDIIINAPLSPGYNFNNATLGNNGSAASLSNAGKVAAQGLSSFALARSNSELGFSGLVLSASSSAVSALLRALQENRRIEILSRPQIMAMDGREGSVQVGEDVPTIAGVNITEFGQNNVIEYRSVGLILRVVPYINPDGLVVMEIQAEKSAVGPLSEGIPVSIVDGQPINTPRINITRAYTTVSALSGQTIVLSGLLEKETRDLHRRVPIIADIPLLGDLFRYDSVMEERHELLIIMTPRVVRSKIEAEMIKQVESSRMSWVLSDVINMHGPAGLRSRCDEWYAGESESVYPTYVPEEGDVLKGEGEALPLPTNGDDTSNDGPVLEGPTPRQPDSLGSNRLQIADPNVQTTAAGEPRRLPPAE